VKWPFSPVSADDVARRRARRAFLLDVAGEILDDYDRRGPGAKLTRAESRTVRRILRECERLRW
jgi:hypothetical protein